MKIMSALAKRAVAALAIVMLATPLWAQTMHSGERTDDFTGIRRNMTALRPAPCGLNQAAVGSTCVNIAVTPPQPTCGAGSVFSGGSCVAMPQMPASCGSGYVLSGGGCVATGQVRSWVSYLLGRTFYIGQYILTINWDGSQNITYWDGHPLINTTEVPNGDNYVYFGSRGGNCVSTLYTYPTKDRDALLNGGPPTGVGLGEERTGGCAD